VHGNLSIRHHSFALHKKSLFCSQVRGEVAYMFIQAKRKLKPIYTSPLGPRKFDGTALTTNESWQFWAWAWSDIGAKQDSRRNVHGYPTKQQTKPLTLPTGNVLPSPAGATPARPRPGVARRPAQPRTAVTERKGGRRTCSSPSPAKRSGRNASPAPSQSPLRPWEGRGLAYRESRWIYSLIAKLLRLRRKGMKRARLLSRGGEGRGDERMWFWATARLVSQPQLGENWRRKKKNSAFSFSAWWWWSWTMADWLRLSCYYLPGPWWVVTGEWFSYSKPCSQIKIKRVKRGHILYSPRGR